jgi:hypothetical protein
VSLIYVQPLKSDSQQNHAKQQAALSLEVPDPRDAGHRAGDDHARLLGVRNKYDDIVRRDLQVAARVIDRGLEVGSGVAQLLQHVIHGAPDPRGQRVSGQGQNARLQVRQRGQYPVRELRRQGLGLLVNGGSSPLLKLLAVLVFLLLRGILLLLFAFLACFLFLRRLWWLLLLLLLLLLKCGLTRPRFTAEPEARGA